MITTMNYKEKYDKALERMKSWAKGEHPECFSEAQKVAEFIFPELKESEDERIRKTIYNCVKWFGFDSHYFKNVSQEECLAWLEKQGEQNLVWGEEDELMFTSTINSLKLTNGVCDMKIDWLKSIKDRVQPHWKPTDEQMQSLYFAIITYSKKDDCKFTYDGLNSLYDDLKKL